MAYSYTTNSNLLASIADTTSGWTQTRSYLSNRDLLDVIETKVSTVSKSKFDYAHDDLGRRTSVAKTGGLYSRYGNGSQGLDTTWGYDDRSQVNSEQTKLGGSSTVITGRDDAYAFDNIGNRATTSGTTHNGNTANYTTNALNQYTQRSVPGVFDVAGAAGSGTTVTVNGSNTGVTRHGEYFFKGHALTNTSTAVFSTLAISDGTTSFNLAAFLALTPEAFTYDDDGNLTSDGRWDYTYDAENRLVSMQTHATSTPFPIANADARRLEFKNDYLGRRVQKTVRSGWNGSSFTTVESDEKFVYSGWNCIAKLNAASSNALVASYYWGLDWSSTLQGAGGVGGLALTVDGGNTYLPMYDGNGNVTGMIKASTGTIEAAYEYDAFGNTLRESGTYAASNPFRFSTKYTDTETGLLYYGLRYYSPSLGRFINRDPIGEKGGLNLYAFVRNNGVNSYDILGLSGPRGSEVLTDMLLPKDPDWYDLYGDGGGKDASDLPTWVTVISVGFVDDLRTIVGGLLRADFAAARARDAARANNSTTNDPNSTGSGGSVTLGEGAEITADVRTPAFYPDGTPMRYGNIGPVMSVEYDALNTINWGTAFTPSTYTTSVRYNGPDLSTRNTSGDAWRAVAGSFEERGNVLRYGATAIPVATAVVVAAPVLALGSAPALVAGGNALLYSAKVAAANFALRAGAVGTASIGGYKSIETFKLLGESALKNTQVIYYRAAETFAAAARSVGGASGPPKP